MRERGLIGDFEGPYPLHDVATALLMAGHPADSVDNYLIKLNEVPYGCSHDCRYDVQAAIVAMHYLHTPGMRNLEIEKR